MKEEAAQLLLYCPDKQGILAEVTDFITVNKGNIIYLDQYVDHAENVFFMRISWDLDGFLIPKEKIEDYFNTLYAQKYQMTFRLYFSGTKPKMAPRPPTIPSQTSESTRPPSSVPPATRASCTTVVIPGT